MIDYDYIFDKMDVAEANCDKDTGEVIEKHEPTKNTLEEVLEQKAAVRSFYEGMEYDEKQKQALKELAPIKDNGIIIAVKPDVFNLTLAKSKLDGDNVGELVAKAEAFIIETDEDANYGTSIAMQSRKMGNSIEKARKAIVAPHISFQKAVKQYADEFTKCLKDIETSITKKIGTHNKIKEDILRKEFEAKQKLERERVAKENERIAKENALKKVEAIKNNKEVEEIKEVVIPEKEVFVTPPKKISTEDGSMVTIVEWVYAIEDNKIIPLEYMQVNEKAIKEAVKAGVRIIPGVKIYEERKERFRVK